MWRTTLPAKGFGAVAGRGREIAILRKYSLVICVAFLCGELATINHTDLAHGATLHLATSFLGRVGTKTWNEFVFFFMRV